jgi:hypothetical protein
VPTAPNCCCLAATPLPRPVLPLPHLAGVMFVVDVHHLLMQGALLVHQGPYLVVGAQQGIGQAHAHHQQRGRSYVRQPKPGAFLLLPAGPHWLAWIGSAKHGVHLLLRQPTPARSLARSCWEAERHIHCAHTRSLMNALGTCTLCGCYA